MILSMTALWSILTFFTVYADPFALTGVTTNPVYAHFAVYKALGVAGIFLQTVLLVGFVLIMLRRWRLPMGTFTLLLAQALAAALQRGDPRECVTLARQYTWEKCTRQFLNNLVRARTTRTIWFPEQGRPREPIQAAAR